MSISTHIKEHAILNVKSHISGDFDLADLGDVDKTDIGIGKILKVGSDGATHEYVVDESGTDEKVKYDASDPTAGYIADKFVAGNGILLAEGTVANENKLRISGSYTAGAGLLLSTAQFSLNPNVNISKITGLTTNGFIKTSGGDGTLGIDTATYLTALAHSALSDMPDTPGTNTDHDARYLTKLVKTSRYITTQTIPATDNTVFCNTDGGAWTATLPAGVEGQTFRIINCSSGGNDLTLTPNGAEELLGSNSNYTLRDGEVLIITYNVTEGWF